MENFIYHNPTKIIFGKGMESTVGTEISQYSKKILLHYGKSSIKTSGLYDKVISSLKKAGVKFTELAGVNPNPRLSLVREGIEICRKEKINFILAVGGGSTIDSSKGIALGVPYRGDVWDFYTGKAEPKEALGVGTILTLPASGSESSPASVITNEDGCLKRSINNEIIYPRFSILNPELTFTLPKYQIACGAADIMAHLMERYFTNTKNVELTDRLIEADMKTIINNAPKLIKNSKDYDAWAEVMWGGTIAHNNLLNTGRQGDWASHRIEHELSGIYDVTHGAGLAVIFPAWMKYVYKHDIARFVQFATRVWDVKQSNDDEKTALMGIEELTKFFRSLGLPTSFKDLGIKGDRIDEMADKCINKNYKPTGVFVEFKNTEDVANIYRIANCTK